MQAGRTLLLGDIRVPRSLPITTRDVDTRLLTLTGNKELHTMAEIKRTKQQCKWDILKQHQTKTYTKKNTHAQTIKNTT